MKYLLLVDKIQFLNSINSTIFLELLNLFKIRITNDDKIPNYLDYLAIILILKY